MDILKITLHRETDFERLNNCLSALLGGVEFKSVSSILSTEQNVGSIGWRKKAKLTRRGLQAEQSGIRRCLQLARFKCESNYLREVSMEALKSDLEKWKTKWGALQSKSKSNTRVLSLEGIVMIEDERFYKILGHAHKKNSLHFNKGNAITKSIMEKEKSGCCLTITCYGLGLTKDCACLLEELFELAAAVKKHTLRKMVKPIDLDVKAVTKKYVARPLPVLYQFDGLNYVNYEGHVRTTRPDISEILAEEAEEINSVNSRYNDAVEGRDLDSLEPLSIHRYIKY